MTFFSGWGRQGERNGGGALALGGPRWGFSTVRFDYRRPKVQAVIRATLFDRRIIPPIHIFIVFLQNRLGFQLGGMRNLRLEVGDCSWGVARSWCNGW